MELTAGGALPPSAPDGADTSRIASVPWDAKDVLIGILLFLGVLILLPLPVAIPLYALYDDDTRAFLIPATLLSAVLYVVVIALAAYLTFGRHGGGWARLGIRAPTIGTFGWAFAAFVGAYAASITYGAIVIGFDLEFLQQDCADQVPLEVRNDALVLALTAVAAICFAPLAEEIFFRGFVFPGLARSFGIALGIIASGAIFGVAHLGNPLLYKSLIPFILIGMVFAAAYWKSGNLLSTLLAHATFNAISIAVIASTTCDP
jgi:membrane protease YdiL (CAAX protease family)